VQIEAWNLDVKHAPRNQLPKALRLARRAAGLPQESFAGVSGRTYLSQLERGERKPTLAKLDDLAAVLGIHPATLVALSYLPESASPAEMEKLLGRIRTEMAHVMAASSS
jgi:transcriptional regulator with XRE-family HTH domain